MKTLTFFKKILLGLTLFVFCFSLFTQRIQALSTEQKKLYNEYIPYYDIETGCEGGDCVCTTNGTTSDLSGSDNEEKVWNYFIGKGLTVNQVAGIMGNISRESGFNPENSQVGPDTKDPAIFGFGVGVGKAWGLIQWDAGGRAINYAKQAGITSPIHLLETQLDLVWWHMNNSSPTGYSNMLPKLKETTTLEKATEVYEVLMEGAGVKAMADRIGRAVAAKSKYGNEGTTTTTTSSSTQTCTTSSMPGENAAITSDGYALPVRKSGVNLPCRQTTCHHDGTPAADLFRPEGDPVYAITSGKIENFRYRPGFGRTAPAPQECKQFQLVGDDGWSYWYGHIKNVNVDDDDNNRVTAGQKIAEVGPTRCADDTPPHLHIDRGSPKGEFGGRQCCRDPGFIPLLNKIFEDTPN